MRQLLLLILTLPLFGLSQIHTSIWNDNCEIITDWTNSGTGNWSLSTDSHAGTYSFETNGTSNYASSKTYVITSPTINISSYTQCKLSVYLFMATESTYDGGFIEIWNGSSWEQVFNAKMNLSYDGNLINSTNAIGENLCWYEDFGWTELVVDLSEYEGQTDFKFRISFGSDSNTEFRGMRIDDVSVSGYAKTTIYNFGGVSQLVFDNSYQYIDNPIFRISSDIAVSYNRVKVEMNKSAQFADISHVQEFVGTYAKGTEYNITCNQLNPPLTFEDNTVYYTRVVTSSDGGVTWGRWSNQINFTWKATTSSVPQWSQSVNEQFKTDDLSGLEITNNTVQYKSTNIIQKYILQSTDDAVNEYDTWLGSYSLYLDNDNITMGKDLSYDYIGGLRFQDINIPNSATIEQAFIVVDCNNEEDPDHGTSVQANVEIYGEDYDNTATYSSSSSPKDRLVIAETVSWLNTEMWFNQYFYQTPEVTSIVQALVNRAGWVSGNALGFQFKNNAGTDYRKIRTYDDDPSNAAQLYVKYQNTSPGTITSSPIYLASINGATSWQRLMWVEEGTTGDFRITIQKYSAGTWSNTALTNIDYSSSGIDISALAAEAEIRLVGTFTPSGGVTPTLKSWTVTTDNLAGSSDLTLSFNSSDLTPCEQNDVDYTLSVANNGSDEASNIILNVAIPVGMTLQSSSVPKGTYTSGQWIIDALQNGETATLTFTVNVDAGQGGNSLVISPSISSLLQTDPDLTNNAVSLTAVVNSNTSPQISVITDKQTTFNTAFSTINFTVTDAETSSDALSYSVSSDDITLYPSTNISLGGLGTARTLNITPNTNQYGIGEITIIADDGTCSTEQKFNAQTLIHQYSNMESASLVVGQPDFTSTGSTVDASTTVGASSCALSPLGVLAVGSQHTSGYLGDDGRVMIWNSLPTSNGVSCDLVIGKSSATTSTSTPVSSSLTKKIDGIAYSPDGNKLLVSDEVNNRVLIWNTPPTTTGQTADVVIGQSDFTSSSSGCTSQKLNNPKGLFVSADGKLFIVDNGNNRVLIFNSIPTVNNATADVVIGQNSFTTSLSGNSANQLYSPDNCTKSNGGKLLIADVQNNRILIYNSVPVQNGESADYVVGQEDFGISSSGTTASRFSTPVGVTVSPSGMMAVCEFSNNRVLIYNTIPNENGASADVVLGQNSFILGVPYNNGSGSEGSASDDNFHHLYSAYFDINDRLFVNGRDMNRVMVFGSSPTQESDLSIAISTDTDSPCMGNPVTYTISVTNNGTQDASNVVAYASLPSGFYYYSHTAERGTFEPTGGNWKIPKLANGETVSLDIIGTVKSSEGGATIEGYASVRSLNQKETDYSNNSASKTIIITNNHTPTASLIADQKLDINTSTGSVDFVISDEDVAASTLSVTATSSDQTIVKNSNIVLGGSSGNRTVSLTPEAGAHGVTTITVTISDGTCSTSTTFKAYFGNMWIGKTSDWHSLANWTSEVAKSGVEAYIPASPVGGVFPVISNDATVSNLTIEAGASLSCANPVTFTIEGDVVNNGTINLTNGTTLLSNTTTLSGSGIFQVYNINITGALTANGTVKVGNNWTRSGTFTSGTGTVIFNGSVVQVITTSESFNDLGFDNSAGVTVSSATSVADTLELINGAVASSSNITLANNATIVRTSGSLDSAPTFGTNVNVVYKGTCSTGYEIPASHNINNFEMRQSGIVVTMSSSLLINGTLTLQNGVITTGSNTLVIGATSAASISGGGVTSFVNGKLRRYTATNTDTYIFPLGKGVTSNDYYPIDLINNNLTGFTFITGYLSTISEVGDNVNLNLTTTEGGNNNYIDVINTVVWELIPNIEPTSGSYGVNLYFDGPIGVLLTDNKFGVLKRPYGSTSYADWDSFYSTTTVPANDNPGRTVSGGYAQRTGFTSFSQYAVASTQNPLPVRLDYYNVKNIDNKANLTWKTFSELDNDYFIIERSSDGINYTQIAKIGGMGTSSVGENYKYVDKNISEPIYYYKLSQFDFDGTTTVLGIKAVKFSSFNQNVKIYPQPAQNEINIEVIGNFLTNGVLQILDETSRCVVSKEVSLHKGYQIINLDISNVNAGFYILNIKSLDLIITKQVIIGR